MLHRQPRLILCGLVLGLIGSWPAVRGESPAMKVAERTVTKRIPVPEPPPPARTPDTKTLDAILDMAREGYQHIQDEIRDYSCIMVKRERVNGRLGKYQYMQAKVRHQRSDGQGGENIVVTKKTRDRYGV